MCRLTPRDANGCLLHVTDLLIWDEAPMNLAVYWMLVIALSKTTCTMMNLWEENCSSLHFHQVLPVVRKGGRPDVVQACMTNSPLWKHCTTLKLRTNTRVQLKVNAADTQDKERQQTCGLAPVSLGWKVSKCQ